MKTLDRIFDRLAYLDKSGLSKEDLEQALGIKK